jgi:hypothetical protein
MGGYRGDLSLDSTGKSWLGFGSVKVWTSYRGDLSLDSTGKRGQAFRRSYNNPSSSAR